MQPRFIHPRQSTWCRLLSTQLQWCRAITQRPWFRGRYMPTRPGIGVATGTGGAATATGMGGAKPAALRRNKTHSPDVYLIGQATALCVRSRRRSKLRVCEPPRGAFPCPNGSLATLVAIFGATVFASILQKGRPSASFHRVTMDRPRVP